MNTAPQTEPSGKQNGEQLILRAITTVTLLFCAIFGAVLFALHRQQNSSGAVPRTDSEPLVLTPDKPRTLTDFALTDRTGRAVTQADLNGKFLVVSFLFTSCSLTCPAVSKQMAEIQQLTTNQADVKLISLTVDPEDDTIPVLAKYGRRFGADTNRWLFLTGGKREVYSLIQNSFLSADSNSAFAYMPGNFAHIERIALVNTNGQVQGYFDGLNQNVAGAVVSEIARLRK